MKNKSQEDDLFICDNCGAKVDPNGNICLECGAFNNPIQKAMAKKYFKEQMSYSAWIIEAPSFKPMLGNIEISYDDGLKYLEKMKLKEAIEFYLRAVTKEPNNFVYWNNLGVAYMGLKDRQNALDCYKKSVQLNPDYYIGLYNIGGVYFECREYKKAIEFYDKAIEKNPKCAEAFCDKYTAQERMGEFAFGWMAKKLELGAMGMRAELNLNSALVDLGNNLDAPLGYQKLILKNRNQVNQLMDEAIMLIKNNKIKKAIKVLEKCLAINPDVPEALILRGKLYAQINDFKSAYELFDKATKIDGALEEAWLLKGAMLLSQTRSKEALQCFKNVLRINPFHKEVKQILKLSSL